MTPTPKHDVTVNAYLPGMFLTLGYVQAESYWAAPGPALQYRWQAGRVGKTDWRPVQPSSPMNWK